jgi:hypothetical protein
VLLQELDAINERIPARDLDSGRVAGKRFLLGHLCPFGRVGKVRIDLTAHKVDTNIEAELVNGNG